MKKTLLLRLCMLAFCVVGFFKSQGQDISIMEPRLMVDPASGIQGIKAFTNSGSNTWGRAIDSFWQHVPLVKCVADSDACSPVSTSVAGKWVLIHRGNCEFGSKAFKAQTAGAAGVVIWNHTPASPLISMGAGAEGSKVTIPVLFISNEDGVAISNELNNGRQVFISLTRWGFGLQHDLAIVPRSTSVPPGLAIPISQYSGLTSNPYAYRNYTGALLGNVGTSVEYHVKLKATTTFTPQGGSASIVHMDSVTLDTFDVLEVNATKGLNKDSVRVLSAPGSFTVAPTGVGRYDFTYTASADAADQQTSDNTEKSYLDITGNAFCRARWNTAKQEPIFTNGFKYASGNSTWGPLFYVAKGNFKAQCALFELSDGDTTKHSLATQNPVSVYLFKWKDGQSGGLVDSIIQPMELTLKSIAVKQFSTSDSNGYVLKALFGDTTTGNARDIVLEDESWYWVGVDIGNTFYLGCDNTLNYYTRSATAANLTTGAVKDYWAPMYYNSPPVTDTVRMIPFTADPYNINQVAYNSLNGTVPAVAMVIDQFPVNVNNIPSSLPNYITVYPNPAADVINVKLDLDKNADKVYFKIIDGYGRTVALDTKENMKQGQVSMSTKALAAGNYYMIVIADGKAHSRPFTVAAH